MKTIAEIVNANICETLSIVIAYAEAHGMTTGYTSIVYNTPDEDLGFWYRNLVASRDELARVRPETTPLERSNLLIKLRETLLDHGKNGDSVTDPDGIELWPYNLAYAVWGWLSLLSLFGGVVCAFWILEEPYRFRSRRRG